MPDNKAPLIDYAPAPRPMNRARLALLVGSVGGATILIAGTAYQLTSATQPVLMGKVAAPAPAFRPATPATAPALPGDIVAPTTRWAPAPTTGPATK